MALINGKVVPGVVMHETTGARQVHVRMDEEYMQVALFIDCYLEKASFCGSRFNLDGWTTVQGASARDVLNRARERR